MIFTRHRPIGIDDRRKGAAAVELVLVLPVLCFIGLIAVDYSRVFYDWAILADCARNGALYQSDSSFATSTGFANAQAAALADATNLSPSPTITSTSGTDSAGNAYVQVTAAYTFQTVASYPGIPTSVALSRTVRMAVTPP